MKLTRDVKTIPTFADGTLVYLEEIPYRILSHNMPSDTFSDVIIWLIDLSTKTSFRIIKRTENQLREALTCGKITACIDIEEYPTCSLKDGDKAITDLRYRKIQEYVSSLYPNYSVISQRGVSKAGLSELASACGLSEKQIRRYLLLYMQSGGSYLSVVDKRILRSLGDYDPYAGEVKGRKADGKSSKVLTDAKLISIYEEAYADFQVQVTKYNYDSSARYKPTLKGAYMTMILKHFSFVDETGRRTLLPKDEYPSYSRFYKWVCDNKLHGDKVRNHAVSARDRRNNSRLLVGTSDYGVFNPMEMVEIDENEASLCLISANTGTPHQAIGNAITYIAIDVLTHRVVGASVGFANNSYEGFLDLMDSMMMTDEENARMFGSSFDETVSVFPGCRLPKEIRVDHGAEYTSKALTDNLTGGNGSTMMDGIPIAINIVPVATGSLKGVVERIFGNLHRSIQQAVKSGMGYVTGTHQSTHHQKAVLSITDFRKIVYEVVKFHNNSPIVDYPMTPALAKALPIVTPNTLWDYYAATRMCGVDVANEKKRIAARYGFMKKDKVFQLSRRQISFKNTLYWDVGDDTTLKYEAIQCGDGSKKVELRYDPRSINTLYRADPKTGQIHRYLLAEKRPAMKEFQHMRWSVVEQWIPEIRSRRYEAMKQKEEEAILSVGEINDIANQAAEAKGNVKNNSKDRRAYAQVERAALTAYDTARKNEIFYDDSAPIVCSEDELNEAITVTPIAEPDQPNEKIIPAVDLYDAEALAKIYDIEED